MDQNSSSLEYLSLNLISKDCCLKRYDVLHSLNQLKKDYSYYSNFEYYKSDNYSVSIKAKNSLKNEQIILKITNNYKFRQQKQNEILNLSVDQSLKFSALRSISSQICIELGQFLIQEIKLNYGTEDCEEVELNQFSKIIDQNDFIFSEKGLINVQQLEKLSQQEQSLINSLTIYLNYQDNILQKVNKLKEFISKQFNFEQLTLHLYQSRLDVSIAVVLSDTLKILNNLKILHIDLGKNVIKTEGLIAIEKGLLHFQNLTSLNLNVFKNQIILQKSHKFGGFLRNLPNLQILSLDFQQNQIDENGLFFLFTNIGKCKNLQHLCLDLFQNGLKPIDINVLSTNIVNCSKINTLYLDLNCNKIGEGSIEYLSQQICKLNQLSNLHLNIKEIKLSLNTLKTLFYNSLPKCQNLTSLSLHISDVPIQPTASGFIGEGLAQMSSLYYLTLELSNCQINSISMNRILSELWQCKTIINMTLLLNQNNILTKGFTQIGQNLAKCQYLFTLYLDISENKMELSDYKNLIFSLSKSINLSYLHLDISQNCLVEKNIIAMSNILKKTKRLAKYIIDYQ